MDAAEALKDLTEISSQIEAAVLVESGGALLSSTLVNGEAAEKLAGAAHALVAAADALPCDAGEGMLVQLEAATLGGSLFAVRDGERVVAAVTSPTPTAGLVFFDLKSCLRAAAAEKGDGKPRPRAKPRAAPKRTKKVSGEAPS